MKQPSFLSGSTFIEMAPFVDVVLVLLLFFITSSTLLIHQSIQLVLPTASTVEHHTPDLSIHVDHKGNLYVDGERMPLQALANHVQKTIQYKGPIRAVLYADHQTRYAKVITILDTLRLGGCYNILLEANKPLS